MTIFESAKWKTAELLQQGERTGDMSIWQMVIGEAERAAVITALEWHRGNFVRASQALGITRNTLKQRMKFFGIEAT